MTIIVRSNEPAAEAPKPSVTEGTAAELAGNPEQTSAPAEKTGEQKAAEASEASETEELESEGTEASTKGLESEQEHEKEINEEGAAGNAARKKGGFQRRIDKLNAAKATAQQEAEYWKREALKGATAQKDAPKVEIAKPASEGRPDPSTFATHAEYVEALTDWKVDQKDKAREAREQKSRIETERRTVAQTYTERAKAFAAKQPDFAEVLSEVDGIPLSPALQEIILSSENGPELAYELAKDPEEFARVSRLTALSAAREMGKLEARIASKSSETKNPTTNKTTQAPKPMNPIKGGKGAPAKSIYDADRMSQAEFEAMRRAKPKK